jgi:hypothetical protein
MKHHFILDVEATSRTPMTGVMTEFALAHLESDSTFYAHLYVAHPHPDIPALPVVETDEDGNPVEDIWFALDGKTPHPHRPLSFNDLIDAIEGWIADITKGKGRPVLVSDNNGFDAMWFNCWTDDVAQKLLLGHSSRRIGDFYAGICGKWGDHSSWKRLRRTTHTHHPLDDAVGNREALQTVLKIEEQ